MAKAALHRRTEQHVLSSIPEGLNQNVRFVSFYDGELLLQADNPTQASQLRFRQQDIMAALRDVETFQFIWKVKIQVRPRQYQRKPVRNAMNLSNENARLLKEEAGHTKDKALREVLEKLASHASDRPD